MNERQRRTPHAALCIAVIAAVAAACTYAAILGHRRFDQYTWYFYDNGDPGHTGAMNMVATIGFWTVSVMAALVGASLRRWQWWLAASLFVVIGIDYFFRAHNHFPGGDVIARLVYWSVFGYVLQHIWRSVPYGRAHVLLIAGLVMFASSDLIDFFSNEPYGRGAVLEESAGCLGAWLLGLATFGVAQTLLSHSATSDVQRASL